ncbi:MAG: phenylacetate-coenzyme A ligase [Lysobacterales bacterium]|jgi:phenylacetate-CoA ligase|nr:MAG: phenylacetate-coenzyme A ligase [Xanthomonadales bacterium]
MSIPTWYEAIEPRRLLAEYPIGPEFLARFRGMSRDALLALQEERFRRCLERAWEIPFYRRLWGEAGISPGDIRGLADLPKLPTFGKAELMASVESAPPLGDFHGYEPEGPWPMLLHTTSGTTGRPQPIPFGPRSREVQNILLARLYLLQGLNERDVVHSVYGHGLINGGHYVREAVTRYTRALFLSAGTGVETRSQRQVEIMRDFRATVLIGFADYLRKLADVARTAGIEPGRDIPLRMISGHLGREDREQLAAAWGGAELFDWYGVGDTGAIAGEGPDHSGLHLLEDAHYVEILRLEDGQPAAADESGDLVVTCLYKDDLYPIIRFNTHDVTRLVPGENPLGLPFRRIEGFLGRSDQMVKIRGINVFPQALVGHLAELPDATGEYFCIARRDPSGREELLVRIETRNPSDPALAERARELLRARLGLEVLIELVPPGATAADTGIETRQKPLRLRDERFS